MKIKTSIIGTGNIGTDLLIKSLKSNFLELTSFVGRRESSDGIKKAKELGVNTSTEGINFYSKLDNIPDIVFDCTDAYSALKNWEIFSKLNIKVIDLTPAKIGEMCIPIINGDLINTNNNLNMITCGGQTSIPILNFVSKYCDYINYIEVVSQIASKSAGIATRINIDQYIDTTELAIKKFTNCKKCKVILNLNPAEPCVDMQTTMFIKFNEINFDELKQNIKTKISEIKQYVPFYEMIVEPMINEQQTLILSMKVKGAGDYLPSYAGNLDIINCASIYIAKKYFHEKYNNK